MPKNKEVLWNRIIILIAGKAFIFQMLLWLFDKKMLVRYFGVIPESEKATDEFKKQGEKGRIEELVENGKIIEALEILKALFKDDIETRDKLIALIGQYNTYNHDYTHKRMSLKSFNIEKNRITTAILGHIKDIAFKSTQ